jgi:hypothetical protein
VPINFHSIRRSGRRRRGRRRFFPPAGISARFPLCRGNYLFAISVPLNFIIDVPFAFHQRFALAASLGRGAKRPADRYLDNYINNINGEIMHAQYVRCALIISCRRLLRLLIKGDSLNFSN